MELFNNPDLKGVAKTLTIGGRSQNIPPGWEVVQLGWNDTNPASEIYAKDGGYEVRIGYRTVWLLFYQNVTLEPGRYLLKADIDRHTTGGKETDVQWGLYIEPTSGGKYSYQTTSSIPSTSSGGEQLTVFQVNKAMTARVGLLVTTSYGSLDGYLLYKHIGLESVAADYGTPAVTFDATEIPPAGGSDTPNPPELPTVPAVPGAVVLTQAEWAELNGYMISANQYLMAYIKRLNDIIRVSGG